MKPVAEHCLRNQQPIADALKPYLIEGSAWLELGSGTGQHGVFIAGRHPEVNWQLSDTEEAQPGLLAWQSESGLTNLPAPHVLDVMRDIAPADAFDGVFTANTVHFVGWSVVEALVQCAATALKSGGWFVIYGPFNQEGAYTSDGNASLDQWLKMRDPLSGIKDELDISQLAAAVGMDYVTGQDMPANNRLLVFRKN